MDTMRDLGYVERKNCFSSTATAVILFREIAWEPAWAGSVIMIIMVGARV